MNNSIEIKKLSKILSGNSILKDVSFAAMPGKITAFLGLNGAGKSTTFRILLGLDRPSSGSAYFDGRLYSEFKFPLLHVGASFDGIGGPMDRTVYQHLRIISSSNGICKSRIREVLRLTDISHKSSSKLGNLSLGEGQRLGLSIALLGDPQFLVLDEPTNGLDPAGIRWFRSFIRNQAKLGKTVLFSSHILSEVEAIADYIVIINKGEIISKGNLKEILKDLPSLEEMFFNITNRGTNS